MNKGYAAPRMEHAVINFAFITPCIRASQLTCVEHNCT